MGDAETHQQPASRADDIGEALQYIASLADDETAEVAG
jgi:hypothetical protein